MPYDPKFEWAIEQWMECDKLKDDYQQWHQDAVVERDKAVARVKELEQKIKEMIAKMQTMQG